MSDPFETFESAFTNGETVTKVNSDDPAAEFLAREQAELEKIENNGFEDFNGLFISIKLVLLFKKSY
jgi:hypothetical protein